MDLVQVFEKLTGVIVASPKDPELTSNGVSTTSNITKFEKLEKDSTLQALPEEWPQDATEEVLKVEQEGRAKVLVVLDDDPTGTQTVHGVTVLTEWWVDSEGKNLDRVWSSELVA